MAKKHKRSKVVSWYFAKLFLQIFKPTEVTAVGLLEFPAKTVSFALGFNHRTSDIEHSACCRRYLLKYRRSSIFAPWMLNWEAMAPNGPQVIGVKQINAFHGIIVMWRVPQIKRASLPLTLSRLMYFKWAHLSLLCDLEKITVATTPIIFAWDIPLFSLLKSMSKNMHGKVLKGIFLASMVDSGIAEEQVEPNDRKFDILTC